MDDSMTVIHALRLTKGWDSLRELILADHETVSRPDDIGKTHEFGIVIPKTLALVRFEQLEMSGPNFELIWSLLWPWIEELTLHNMQMWDLESEPSPGFTVFAGSLRQLCLSEIRGPELDRNTWASDFLLAPWASGYHYLLSHPFPALEVLTIAHSQCSASISFCYARLTIFTGHTSWVNSGDVCDVMRVVRRAVDDGRFPALKRLTLSFDPRTLNGSYLEPYKKYKFKLGDACVKRGVTFARV
jgi:hypothetical protein